MINPTPESARFAAHTAFATPTIFRYTHGTSTSPSTGSHTSPNRFMPAKPAASAQASGVPPARSHSAAAAIALAEPHSA